MSDQDPRYLEPDQIFPAGRPVRLSFGQALRLYIRDANKLQLAALLRVLLLVLAGYAPFAALNDVLAPFLLGIPVFDDWEIPLGIIAGIKIILDVLKYRDPGFRGK